MMKNVQLLLVAAFMTLLAQVGQAQELSRHDHLKMAVQKICPISGQELGSMGQPLKVAVGQEELFVCCKGCLEREINPQHWATIHANFAAAQRICPVMKHELPANPQWTIVEGQIVYVCCPPCTKKIAADPAKFLTQLDDLYLASLQAKNANR